jgi:hypothetical protein
VGSKYSLRAADYQLLADFVDMPVARMKALLRIAALLTQHGS